MPTTFNLDAAEAAAATPDWSRTVLLHGDIHHGAANVSARTAFSQPAIQAMVPATLAALVQMGDMVEPDSAANDTTAKTYLNSLPGVIKRCLVGNHDCDTGRTCDAAATAFGYNARNWTATIAGVAKLIGVSPATYPAVGGADEGTCALDTTALTYLDTELGNTSLPCIVLVHAPLQNTVISPTTGLNAGYSSDEAVFSLDPDATVRSTLNAHSTAKVVAGGHTHSRMSATGFVKLESVGTRNVVCVNSSAVRGQSRPPDLLDPILVVAVTLTTANVEVRVLDCRIRRWVRWPDTGAFAKQLAIPA
jgi:hypothetical protein